MDRQVTAPKKNVDSLKAPPFETADLRKHLAAFLDSDHPDAPAHEKINVGDCRWGVYAFYDYDGEPIYVGQTNESLRTRIRRHLTNQRTDAVAMSVLDPFEVFEIEVWPLFEFQELTSKQKETEAYKHARAQLDALEHTVYQRAEQSSKFKVVLNEKNPRLPTVKADLPRSLRMNVVSKEVQAIRAHPDFRIARRALIIARLAQVISERQVQGGLRRVLLAQAKRLQWLADRRYQALGGPSIVREEPEEPEEPA